MCLGSRSAPTPQATPVQPPPAQPLPPQTVTRQSAQQNVNPAATAANPTRRGLINTSSSGLSTRANTSGIRLLSGVA